MHSVCDVQFDCFTLQAHLAMFPRLRFMCVHNNMSWCSFITVRIMYIYICTYVPSSYIARVYFSYRKLFIDKGTKHININQELQSCAIEIKCHWPHTLAQCLPCVYELSSGILKNDFFFFVLYSCLFLCGQQSSTHQ